MKTAPPINCRFIYAATSWLRGITCLALSAATVLMVQRTAPSHLSTAALHTVLLHATNVSTAKCEAGLMLQAVHLLRITTALVAGLTIGLTAAAWQSLRRAPGACPQLSGMPLAASLGAIGGHALLQNGLSSAVPEPLSHSLPVATGFLGALVMSGTWTALMHLRAQRAMRTWGPWAAGDGATSQDSAAVLLATGALSVWLLHRFVPTQPAGAAHWLVGSFARGHLAPWPAALLSLSLGVAILTYVSRGITQLLAGDAWAQLDGIDIMRTRIWALIGICLLLSAAINLAGNMLGIGLVAAAVARACVGDMPRLLWPTAGGLGAVGAVWIDALARASGDVQEFPVAAIGAALAALGLILQPQPNTNVKD